MCSDFKYFFRGDFQSNHLKHTDFELISKSVLTYDLQFCDFDLNKKIQRLFPSSQHSYCLAVSEQIKHGNSSREAWVFGLSHVLQPKGRSIQIFSPPLMHSYTVWRTASKCGNINNHGEERISIGWLPHKVPVGSPWARRAYYLW